MLQKPLPYTHTYTRKKRLLYHVSTTYIIYTQKRLVKQYKGIGHLYTTIWVYSFLAGSDVFNLCDQLHVYYTYVPVFGIYTHNAIDYYTHKSINIRHSMATKNPLFTTIGTSPFALHT